jgi:hypothetical protein
MDAASRACEPPTLSKDSYSGCGSVSRRSLGEHSEFPGRHVLRLAFVLLEPSDGKLSRSVPRGAGRGQPRLATLRPESLFRGMEEVPELISFCHAPSTVGSNKGLPFSRTNLNQ